MRDANLQVNKKTLSHILIHVFFVHILRVHHNYLPRRGFESVRRHPALTFSWVQFLSNKLKFFLSCNIKITRTSFFLLCFDTYLFIKKYFAPEENFPSVRVRVRVSFRVGEQFSSGAIVLEPYITKPFRHSKI